VIVRIAATLHRLCAWPDRSDRDLGGYEAVDPWAYFSVQAWLFILIGLSIAFFLGMVVYHRVRSDSPVVQQQSRIMLWGGAIAFLPVTFWIVQSLLVASSPFISLLYMPSLVAFPFAIAYASCAITS
jgi:hypothetical protein